MSRGAINSGRRKEYSSDSSGKKCGSNSNAECQSRKKPRTKNSRMAQEDNKSNVPTNVGPQVPCLQFKRWGTCAIGDRCRYAHTTGGSAYGPSQAIEVGQRSLGGGSSYGPSQGIGVGQGSLAGGSAYGPSQAIGVGQRSLAIGSAYGPSQGIGVAQGHLGGASEYGPSQGILVGQGNPGLVESCHFFASGKGCPDGNECQFLHARNRKLEGGKGLIRESSAITIVPSGREVRKRTHSDTVEPKSSVDLHNKSLKTKLCNRWERSGSCSYGAVCQFAHGKAELQTYGSSIPPVWPSSTRVPIPAKDEASDSMGSSAQPERKALFRGKDVYRMAEIYGDWIEKRPPPPQ